jgi:hypothetical protein
MSVQDTGHLMPPTATMSDFDVVIDQIARRVYLNVDVEMLGFMGQAKGLGGYWLKVTPSQYQYVNTACNCDTPGGVLGDMFELTPQSEYDQFDDVRFGVDYSCFTGNGPGTIFVGAFKLYSVRKNDVEHVDDPTITHIGPPIHLVGIIWSSGKDGDRGEPVLRELSDSELRELRAAIDAGTIEFLDP